MVKGYAQVFGVDFSENFVPIARLDALMLVLALVGSKKSAFLNGYLQEEIYVEQPEGFAITRQEDKV